VASRFYPLFVSLCPWFFGVLFSSSFPPFFKLSLFVVFNYWEEGNSTPLSPPCRLRYLFDLFPLWPYYLVFFWCNVGWDPPPPIYIQFPCLDFPSFSDWSWYCLTTFLVHVHDLNCCPRCGVSGGPPLNNCGFQVFCSVPELLYVSGTDR